MKKLLILALLFFPSLAFAQGVRIGDPTQVTTVQTPGGVIYTVPNASVSFCASPANQVPCTNRVTTYTDITLTTPCPTATQIVLATTNQCVGTTDQFGNWGVWVSPNPRYDYTITLPNGASLGPYTVTVPGGGGGGGFAPGGDLTGSNINQQVVGLHFGTNSIALSATNPIGCLQVVGGILAGIGIPCSTGSGFTAGGDLTGSSSSQQVVGLHFGANAAALANSAASGCLNLAGGTITPTGTTCSAGGGGGTPGGLDTQLQVNQGGAFAGFPNFGLDNSSSPSLLTDPWDLAVAGPNPGYDIRTLGARPVLVTTTATGTAGSGAITVSAASYLNKDGIVILGGGATVSVTAPGSVTFTSGESESATQFNAPITSGLTGTASYCYTIVGITPARGLTAASPQFCTSTGPNSLGAQSVNISSESSLNGTISFTASGTTGLQSNAVIHATAGSNSTQLSGWFPVTVDTGTTFHVSNALPYSTPAVSTASGHFVYFVGNQLAWNASAGIDFYAVCASRPADSGAFHIIGYTLPQIPTYSTTAEVFDDWGATLSSNPPNPWYISDAACTAVSSRPELYTGTVISGGTTTSLNVSPNLGNNVTTATAHVDNSPAILAAANLAKGKTYTVIPALTTSAVWYIWYPLYLPAGASTVQAGPIQAQDVIKQIPFGGGASGSMWTGGFNAGEIGCPAFAIKCGPVITGGGPITFWNDGSSLRDVTINYDANGIGLLSDKTCFGNPCYYDGVNSTPGSGTNDNMGMAVVQRGGELQMKNGYIAGGPGQVIDQTWTPSYLGMDWNDGTQHSIGEITFSGMHGNRRGMLLIQHGGPAMQLHVDHYRRQGGITPLITLQNTAGSVTGSFEIRHPFGDTESDAKIAFFTNLGGFSSNSTVRLAVSQPASTDGGGTPADITGGGGNGNMPPFYIAALGDGGQNPTGWQLLNGQAVINAPINVPGSTNTGSSTVAGNESVTGTASVGTLSAGNSYSLLSAGAANPLANFFAVGHSSTATVTAGPGSVAAGTAMAVGIFAGNTGSSISSITDTLGTTYTLLGSQSLAGAGGGVMFWYFGCVPAGGTDTVSVTALFSPNNLAVWNVSGVNCANPLDVAKFSLATTATPSVATITTANANELVLAFANTGTGITATPGAGYTLDHSGTVVSGSNEMQHAVFAAGGSTTNAPMTLSSSAATMYAVVALVGQIPQVGSAVNPWLAGYFNNITITSLTPGNCVQAGAGGLLTTVAGACGSGGGGGANTTLSNLGTTALNADLLCASAGSCNLGSGAIPFNNIFFQGSIVGPSSPWSWKGINGVCGGAQTGYTVFCIGDSATNQALESDNGGPFLPPLKGTGTFTPGDLVSVTSINPLNVQDAGIALPSGGRLYTATFSGADPSVRTQACFAQLKINNAQGGICDMSGEPLAETWTVNPFAVSLTVVPGASNNIPTSGELVLPCGANITVNTPVVMPNRWKMSSCWNTPIFGQAGANIQASATNFPNPTSPAGTVTFGVVSGNSSTVTGAGTAFSASWVGCDMISPATQPTAANSTYGNIVAVNVGAQTLTLGGATLNGTGAPGGSTFVIECPVIMKGNGYNNNVGGSAQSGMVLSGVGTDCNNLATCVGIQNWYAQENSTIDHFFIRGFTNIGLDVEGAGSQNSGPYEIGNIAPSTAGCSANTMAVVFNLGSEPHRGIGRLTIAQGSGCSTAPGIGVYLGTSSGTLYDIFCQQVTTCVEVASNVSCPIACAVPPHHAFAASLRNIGGGVSGTTVVDLSNAIISHQDVSVANVQVYGGYANALVDHTTGCTETQSRLGSYIQNHASGIGSSTSTTAGCRDGTVLKVNFTTAGATTSDVVTVTGMSSSGHCTVSPSNATAATGMAVGTTWLDTPATNAITLHHTNTNGQIFTIACTPN